MDIKTINTPEKLHQAISKFLQSDYSQENLVEIYNDALKCVARFRVDYLELPVLPRKDDPLYGLQDVMDWCNKSSKVVDDIVFDLEREIISKIIGQFKKLKDIADRALSLVDSQLREQAQKEARAKVENEYKNLNEEASKLKVEEILRSRRLEIMGELQQKQYDLIRRETEDIVQIYLSKDPTFKNKLSQLHEEEINKTLEVINKLVNSGTPTGKLLDIYCKLKDIPLRQQFNDVGYAYSLDDYTDIICGGCDRLYTSIDTVIKTFEEIQTKAERKTGDRSNPQENGGQTEEQQLAVQIINALNEWVGVSECEKLPDDYRPNHCLGFRLSIRNKVWMQSILLKLLAEGKDGLAKRIEKVRDEFLDDVNASNKDWDPTDPMYLPDLGLSHRAGNLVNALNAALPCLGKKTTENVGGKTDLTGTKPLEAKQEDAPTTIININKLGVLGDIQQVETLQTGDNTSTHKHIWNEEKKKGILSRIPYWIYLLVSFFAALFACIHYWPEIHHKLQSLFSQ